MKIPFNKPYMTGKELHYIAQAHFNEMLAGDGPFTNKCHHWLRKRTLAHQALLTHSCTAALELAAILIDTSPGDEIIMPSFTFVSTANAFVLRGGIPVFIDIRQDTLNMDENLLEDAITPQTKAVVPVHYAGVSCEMDTITNIAYHNNLEVIEDAAQGIMASYKGKPLGSIGNLGAYSFHETKNVISGEGGALLVNDTRYALRAEIIREKGTDRSLFLRGDTDKYTWQEAGSSFLPGELIAAFLWAQLEEADAITAQRLEYWEVYHDLLAPLEKLNLLRRPIVPPECKHNAHTYYIILPSGVDRKKLLNLLNQKNFFPLSHYVPLHTSPAGKRFARYHGNLTVTDHIADKILRLPLWIGLSFESQTRAVEIIEDSIKELL